LSNEENDFDMFILFLNSILEYEISKFLFKDEEIVNIFEKKILLLKNFENLNLLLEKYYNLIKSNTLQINNFNEIYDYLEQQEVNFIIFNKINREQILQFKIKIR
jgi:hypothetical protein